MLDYYKILRVSSDATEDDIKKAYRELASKYHPDKDKSATTETKFKEINEAYSTLSNPKLREEYDKGYIEYLKRESERLNNKYHQNSSNYQSNNRSSNKTNKTQDNTSGQGTYSTIPHAVKKWSWGAFVLGPIWSIANNVKFGCLLYILFFVPYVNFIAIPFISILAGIKGREWAWRDKRWEDLDQFNRIQIKWDNWGKGVFYLTIVVIVIIILAALSYSNNNSNTQDGQSNYTPTDTLYSTTIQSTPIIDYSKIIIGNIQDLETDNYGVVFNHGQFNVTITNNTGVPLNKFTFKFVYSKYKGGPALDTGYSTCASFEINSNCNDAINTGETKIYKVVSNSEIQYGTWNWVTVYLNSVQQSY